MLDSGDNEFVYISCREAISKGIAKFSVKKLDKGFSKKELKYYKSKYKGKF